MEGDKERAVNEVLFIQATSERTGLSPSTCKELLQKGWTYKEQLYHTPVWVHPSARVTRTTNA